ncbi:DUF1648 domain-containing protein [Streptomyces sp. NRRL F-4474]|uniref:DUF1648 domain-containing protein n=1 Tax=Streptomyces sp. NRRL F-4474 TaxID=1463851 RepID=UPI000A484A43|nr:DUF1648 domain-containing protein [Streptomyces sp. NRRL F-4474]
MRDRDDRGGSKDGAPWGVAAWAAGILALLVVLPLTARRGLRERLATHWGGSGEPDGSLPLWAVVVVPAVIWAVLVAGAVVWRAARGWTTVVLASGGVLLAGVQVSVVRANLYAADWRDADSVTVGAAVTVAASLAAALAATRVGHRPRVAEKPAGEGPRMDIPAGERRVWLSRTVNPWLGLISAVAGVAAASVLLVGLSGLTETMWMLIVPLAMVSLAFLTCSSVRVLVTGRGVEAAFGPLAWPVRRWAPADIESARVETRTPAQVGGWGYRLSGLGTTVMLRSGECLVVRVKGKDFAVSVDDAERGAALLNSLTGMSAGRP